MYGRLHQRKLREDDYIMSCQKARAQLDSYIDQEARRVNIDSAKKRAVLQHMDYEGFRQMVLGANIFPTKSLQLQKFSKGQNSSTNHNKFYTNQQQINEQTHKINEQTHKINEQINNKRVGEQVIKRVEGRSQLECNSFREFKKKFNEYYGFLNNNELNFVKGQELYRLIKYQNQNRIGKIFNMDCQASILVKIVSVFEYINGYLRESDSEGRVVKQVIYQVKLIQTILRLKNMRQFNLMVLSKKEKNKLIDYLLSTKKYILSKQNTQHQSNDKDDDQRVIDELVQIIIKK